jgi:hypothetical protein
MFADHREDVEGREVSRVTPCCNIQLGANPAHDFWTVTFRRQHPAEKKQVASLDGFHVCSERFGRIRKRDAKFFQSLLGAALPRAFEG